MDQTDCLGLPYPQCDPPLTKDASDIVHLRNLAEAVDEAVGDYAQAIDDQVVSPDCCRLANNIALVSTLADNVLTMDGTTFDNTPGDAMSDLTNGVVRIQTTGWYYVMGWVTSTVATDVQTRIRFIVNSEPANNFGGPSGLAQAGVQQCNALEMLFLQAGDGVTIATRNGAPGTSVSYNGRLAVCLIAPNVST